MSHRDPAGVALRRATRAAIAVPISVVLLTSIPALADTALFGVFAVLALLIFADFGGPLRRRAAAYLSTVAAGIPIMMIGSVAGQTMAGAMGMMAVVATVLGMLAVLRGFVASAQTTLLLATVLAVTSSPPGSLFTGAASWLLGGLLATTAALVLWPAPAAAALRNNLTAVMRQVSRVVALRWDPQHDPAALPDEDASLDRCLDKLHECFDGNLQRPAGVTAKDRAISELVDIASRFRTFQHLREASDTEDHPELDDANHQLAVAVSDSLAETAEVISGNKGAPAPDSLAKARSIHLDAVAHWAGYAHVQGAGRSVRVTMEQAFPLRVTSVSAELAAANAAALQAGGETGFYDPAMQAELNRPRSGVWGRIQSHLSWESAWFRNALRSAIALSLSVGIAKYLGLGHEFWIVLGTLSALRFDALGTGRTVIQAFLGTAVGVLIAIGLIWIVGDGSPIWWGLLPVAILFAAYTPGTFSLAVGQAGFSLAVLVLYSLLFPARIETAELRILEVSIGLAVSFCVAILMWPRGVTATLYTRMDQAVTAATDHLVAAVDYTCGGAIDKAALAQYGTASWNAIDRAQEAFDLSVAQKPPEAVPMWQWSRVSTSARLLDFAAHLYPGLMHLVSERGPNRIVPDRLVGPMLDAAGEVRQDLRKTMKLWLSTSNAQSVEPEKSAVNPNDFLPTSDLMALELAIDAYIQTPSDWRGAGSDPRPVLISWMTDWLAQIEWNTRTLRDDIRRNTEQSQTADTTAH
jgi:uncharacterized membrane protein YgaE (UPF0421/DUF939 family)